MREIKNRAEILERAARRANIEMSLGKQLQQAFNQGPVIQKFRDFVGQAVEQLLVMATRDASKITNAKDAWRVRDENAWIKKFIAGEGFLGVWRGGGGSIDNLKTVMQRRGTWTAADCSDLIRLYCTVMESKTDRANVTPLRQGANPFVGQDVAQLHDSSRPGGNPIWHAGRARGKAGKGPAQVKPGEPGSVLGRATMLSHRVDPKAGAGIQRWKLLSNSTVRKIDAVFGLPEGADISGTTSDSIFFMMHVNEFFKRSGGMHFGDFLPVAQMLPLATMIAHCHHTVLESALSLTLNKICTYSIGFYSTLMPTTRSTSEAVMTIRHILQHHEEMGRDLHILCFFDKDTRQWKGYHFNKPEEHDRFKQLATTGVNFLHGFARFPSLLTRDYLNDLARFQGVWGLVPTEQQLSRKQPSHFAHVMN